MGKSEKKIRKWKKVPFFTSPIRLGGGGTMRHLVRSESLKNTPKLLNQSKFPSQKQKIFEKQILIFFTFELPN